MDKGKGQAPAHLASAPTTQKLPQKFYCALGPNCLHALAAHIANGTFGPPGQMINGRQIKLKAALVQPGAWVACGHVCCWDPVKGSVLSEDKNTCAKLHAWVGCRSIARKVFYKDALYRAVAEGLVPSEWLSKVGNPEVSCASML